MKNSILQMRKKQLNNLRLTEYKEEIKFLHSKLLLASVHGLKEYVHMYNRSPPVPNDGKKSIIKISNWFTNKLDIKCRVIRIGKEPIGIFFNLN